MGDLAVEAGERLAHARRANRLVPALSEDEVPDLGAAYAVQRAAVAAWPQDPIGWKIGATSADTQNRLKLAAPFYGPIFAAHSHPSGSAVPGATGLRGVEIELAFRLGRDLPARDGGWSAAEVADAAAGLYLALEFVATRQEGGLEGRRAVADYGLNHAFVHGPAVEGWRELGLADIRASLLVDGERRAEGSAAVVLGSPLAALQWLADNGPGLQAGQWVSTGTLTGLTALPGPCAVVGDFGRLGQVAAQLS